MTHVLIKACDIVPPLVGYVEGVQGSLLCSWCKGDQTYLELRRSDYCDFCNIRTHTTCVTLSSENTILCFYCLQESFPDEVWKWLQK